MAVRCVSGESGTAHMSDYAELVARLRLIDISTTLVNGEIDLVEDAANAIEALQAQVDETESARECVEARLCEWIGLYIASEVRASRLHEALEATGKVTSLIEFRSIARAALAEQEKK